MALMRGTHGIALQFGLLVLVSESVARLWRENQRATLSLLLLALASPRLRARFISRPHRGAALSKQKRRSRAWLA